MYRQIWVDKRDVDYQRILWNTDRRTDYQLLTVTYGMACAPFLALRVIRQLVEDEGSRFPLAVSLLRNNIYVDDLLFGDGSRDRLLQVRRQLDALFQCGGFQLRKWASNSSELLADIDAHGHGLACIKSLQVDEKLKILGIGWDPTRDNFKVTVSLEGRVPKSKRAILAAIAKIYDPLGWVTPITITAKVFMQQLWREGLAWDEALPVKLQERWHIIFSRLSCLNDFQISRWFGLGTDSQLVELHGFADASNVAYAAVVYARVVICSGEIIILLLAGKSRVAPLHTISVTRLELSAAVLLARLMEFVRRSLGYETVPCFCWTDSIIVLAWLLQQPSKWKTFVANRTADVQTRLPDTEWRHVPTDENPVDCVSRGLLGDELLVHELWWRGPPWLQSSETDWPLRNP
ncbi:uncharacterized protein LOC112589336 [Harpegnathos saltator]|uniref:uncharacterized protein LOC112589336 n=1 Tax=Harpegnathos saltator TaxID=610380 RepID=UPI000DBEED02|nr:uncharacterized protein LOC112589336 [Harpegnathos saltator]